MDKEVKVALKLAIYSRSENLIMVIKVCQTDCQALYLHIKDDQTSWKEFIARNTGMVLLDLQKAFDTVDHRILLMQLETIGLNADGLRWFYSYLSGRTQLVNGQGTC